MITPNANPVLAGSLRESRAFSTGARPEHHDCIGHHGPVLSKALDEFGDDFADQPGALVIPAIIGGVHGAAAARFIDFRPFHSSEVADGCQ